MPLLLSKRIDSNSAYAIWNITETEQQLLEKITETPPNAAPNKKSEWIVTRILIKFLCNTFGIDYTGVNRLPTGKPFLNNSQAEISITHSFPIAGAMLSTSRPCGIDIEMPREKLIKIQSKFLNQSESKYRQDPRALCKIWVAKEVLYKIYGRGGLSFKQDMQVLFTNDELVVGKIIKPGGESDHPIHIETVGDYIMGYNY